MIRCSLQGQLVDMTPLPQIAALEDPGLFKLSQYLVDRGHTERLPFDDQQSIDLIGSEVANRAVSEDIKDLQARRGASQHDTFHSKINKNELYSNVVLQQKSYGGDRNYHSA